MEGMASAGLGLVGAAMREAVKKVGREELAVEQKARGEIRWALSGSRCYNHREHTPLPLAPAPPLCRPVSSQMQHCPPYVGWLVERREGSAMYRPPETWVGGCGCESSEQRFPRIRNSYLKLLSVTDYKLRRVPLANFTAVPPTSTKMQQTRAEGEVFRS